MKDKKISVNAWEKIYEENKDKEVVVDWHGNELVIKKKLSWGEVLSFGEGIVESSFVSESDEYLPFVTDFAIKSGAIQVYTNLRLPENLEKRYDLIENTDIMNVIYDNIDICQFSQIVDSAEKKIENKAQLNVASANKQIEEARISLENTEKRLGELFDGITQEDIANVFNAIGNGQIDEKKIVDAYFNNRNEKE